MLLIPIINPIIKYRSLISSSGQFGTTLTWSGRYLAYSDSVDIIPAVSFNDTEGVFIATSGGTGRPNRQGIKKILSNGSIEWTFLTEGVNSAIDIPLVNGELHEVMASDQDTLYATSNTYWDFTKVSSPSLSAPVSSLNASGTIHTVNIPSVSTGDLIIVVGGYNKNVSTTLPSGWEKELSQNYSRLANGNYFLKKADGTETSTVNFTSSTAAESVWYTYVIPAGEWWDDGIDVKNATLYTAWSNALNTTPNPANMGMTFTGNYAFISSVLTTANETFSVFPTSTINQSQVQNSNLSLATCGIELSSVSSFNASAFTKSGSARYLVSTLGIRPAEGFGYRPLSNGSAIVALNKDGTLKWVTTSSSTSNSCNVTVDPTGTYVFASLNGIWDGESHSGTRRALINAVDGTINSLYIFGALGNKFIFFGADNDKLLAFSNGTTSGLEKIYARSVSDIDGTDLWSLDKNVDFLTSPNNMRKVLRRHDGGIIFANGDTNENYIYSISENGVIENSIDISLLTPISGNTVIRDISYDKYNHLYVFITVLNSIADIIRLDENLNFVYSAVDKGLSSGSSTSSNLLSKAIVADSQTITIDSNGVIYIGEGSGYSGVTNGWVSIITQT